MQQTIRNLLVLVVMAGGVACGLAVGEPVRPPLAREPIRSSLDINLRLISLDEVISSSDLIVVGEVALIHPARWTTPSGSIPADATVEWVWSQEPRLAIYTDTELRVIQVLRGELEGDEIRVRALGGQVGIDSMEVSPSETLELNQRYLLFLSRGDNLQYLADRFGPTHYWACGSVQGIYRIRGDLAVLEVGGFVQSEMPYSQLVEQIQSAIR